MKWLGRRDSFGTRHTASGPRRHLGIAASTDIVHHTASETAMTHIAIQEKLDGKPVTGWNVSGQSSTKARSGGS